MQVYLYEENMKKQKAQEEKEKKQVTLLKNLKICVGELRQKKDSKDPPKEWITKYKEVDLAVHKEKLIKRPSIAVDSLRGSGIEKKTTYKDSDF